jgi:malonyl-CoA/methylmalonyl-CoA synthetase
VHVACLRAGLVVVPTNTAYVSRELAHIVGDAHPKAAVIDDEARATSLREAAGDDLLILDPSVELPDHELADIDSVGADELALLVYTSGTTGAPKGAMLTHRNLLSASEALRRAWRWQADDRLVLSLPLFHIHGLGVGLHGTLLAGASALLRPRFDVADVARVVADEGATLFFGVPTMYSRLAASADVAALGSLRLCVSGSAPLPADLHGAIEAGSGQRVLERYGMSETMMNLSNPYDGDRRPGTVGFALPGVEVRLADGESGEILVRGPNVFQGYWERAAATAEAFDPDGWFHTGDLAERGTDGYVRILGRAKELIITGGFNVYPAEVEDVLRRHPGVQDVAVAGLPDDEWGEIVAAFVVGGDPHDLALDSFAAAELAPHKRPRRWAQIDEVPRNALGKVLRYELSALLQRPTTAEGQR